MAFIIFPVFVFLMVIIIIISYNRLTGTRKKLDKQITEILSLHKKNISLLKTACHNFSKIFPGQASLFDAVPQLILELEAKPARNLFTSANYYNQIKAAVEEIFSATAGPIENSGQPDYTDFVQKEREIISGLENHIDTYNLLVTQFNKKLNQFPHNLLAGMAGLEPYAYYGSRQYEI